MPFEYVDDIATADAAFRAWGATAEELFIAASDALVNVMVERLDSIEPREQRSMALEAEAMEMLLFELLQEIIFYKDADQLLLRVGRVEISACNDHFSLRAEASGEMIDPARHDLIVDVKAVTFHRYRVEQTPEGWEAFVIVDI
ncbi:MAG: archease [Syntrophobacteraceae bacterium]|jgi:SHS2 domain-containing protein|nr:archease [Syntrophobacteraceae bacterium]